MKHYILFITLLGITQAQQYTTPVPILKQINRHNEDGSYSYGYEGADGSYKIESKYPNGEVYGKYGYVDDSGKLREIEYGASKRGFEPQGNEINVAPPTINNNYPVRPLAPNEEDDGQYREDPAVYYKDEKHNNPAPQPNYRSSFAPPKYTQTSYQQQPHQQPAYQQPAYQQPAYQQPNYQQQTYQQPTFRPATKLNFDNFILNQPQPQQPSYNQPIPTYNNAHLAGHPAANVDLNLGSYSVNYRRR